MVLGVVTGLTFYSMAAYLDLLISKGFSPSVVSLGPALILVTGGLSGLWVARLLRRFSTRKLMLSGAVAVGSSLIWLAWARSPLEMCAAFVMIGLTTAFVSSVPCSDLIARWFAPRPARAMSIALTGMSMGGAVTPPVVLAITHRWGLSWGGTIVGVALFVVVTVGALIMRDPGRPDADESMARTAVESVKPDSASGSSSRRRFRLNVPAHPFMLLFIGFVLLVASQVGTVTHIVRITNERNIGGGALLLSTIAAASVVARLLGVFLIDCMGLRRFALMVALIQAGAQIVVASAHGNTSLLIGCVMLGITMGNVFVLISLFVLAAFELHEYPHTYAMLAIAGTIGGGLGPVFLGFSAGWFGSYGPPLVILCVLSLGGAVLLFLSRAGVAVAPRAADISRADRTDSPG